MQWGIHMRTVASMTLAFGCLLAATFAVPAVAAAGNAARRPAASARSCARSTAGAHGTGSRVKSTGASRGPPTSIRRRCSTPNYFAHESRDGSPFHARVRRYVSYRSLGENLAMVGRCGKRRRAGSCGCGWSPPATGRSCWRRPTAASASASASATTAATARAW